MPRSYFRLNKECETGYETCAMSRFNCDRPMGPNHDRVCMPSQVSDRLKLCNRRIQMYKMCDGAFEWCNGRDADQSALQSLEWLDMGCTRIVSKECELRHRCFQQCSENIAGCIFFAIDSEAFHKSMSDQLTNDVCQTFSSLDGTAFSSSSCGPWKVYQMDSEVDAIASTAATTVEIKDSTVVRGLSAL